MFWASLAKPHHAHLKKYFSAKIGLCKDNSDFVGPSFYQGPKIVGPDRNFSGYFGYPLGNSIFLSSILDETKGTSKLKIIEKALKSQ